MRTLQRYLIYLALRWRGEGTTVSNATKVRGAQRSYEGHFILPHPLPLLQRLPSGILLRSSILLLMQPPREVGAVPARGAGTRRPGDSRSPSGVAAVP